MRFMSQCSVETPRDMKSTISMMASSSTRRTSRAMASAALIWPEPMEAVMMR